MVPKAGLEPARVSPPPPQDGVSTRFHHFGTVSPDYFVFSAPDAAGCSCAPGDLAGGAALVSPLGPVCVSFSTADDPPGISVAAGAVAAGLTPLMTDSPVALVERPARTSEVIMKTMATPAVSLPKKVLPPVEPKRV